MYPKIISIRNPVHIPYPIYLRFSVNERNIAKKKVPNNISITGAKCSILRAIHIPQYRMPMANTIPKRK